MFFKTKAKSKQCLLFFPIKIKLSKFLGSEISLFIIFVIVTAFGCVSSDDAVTASSMWFHLFVVFLINSGNARFPNSLGSIDNSGFMKVHKNPGLPFMARHSWKLKTPKMFKLWRTRSDDQMAASRSDYIKNNLWKEPTTETSVPLRNMFQLIERDDIGDYIKYLTKMKVFTRNAQKGNAFNAALDGTNHSSISTSNVPSTITSPTENLPVSKFKNNNNLHLPRSLTVQKRNSIKKTRFRRSGLANILDGGADNTISYSVESQKNNKTTAAEDSYLIQGITEQNKIKPTDKGLMGSRNVLNYWEKKLNESHRSLKKRFKLRSKSNKPLTNNTDKVNTNQTETNKSNDFPIKYNKDSYRNNKGSYADYDSKIHFKKPGVNAKKLKDNIKNPNQRLTNNTRSNLLMKIFNSETLNRLLKMIPFHDTNVNNSEKIFSSSKPGSNVTIMIEKDNINNKPLKFVLPKEELNKADAVLIVFRNLTGLNENRDVMESVLDAHSSTTFRTESESKKEYDRSITDHTESDYQNEYDGSLDNYTLSSESKYKKAKQIMFNSEKRNKLRKLFPDGDIPKKIGSKIILLNQKLSKLNDAHKLFVNNSSKYWLERILNIDNISLNVYTSNKTLGVNEPPDRKQSRYIYISPTWKSNKINKTRTPRSSVFRRRYRSPSKFRIVVKPTKRNNKLGQVSVQIIRDYEPLEDVIGSLNKYFANNPPTAKQRENTTQVKNKTLDTKRNTTSRKSDMQVDEIERYLNSYLGLKSMLLGDFPKRYDTSKSPQKINSENLQPAILSDKVSNEKKTDNVNLFSILGQDIEYNTSYDANQRVKRLSLLTPKPQRNLREVKHVSETRPDRTNTKLYFTKNVPSLKYYNPNKFISPHVDQDLYREYRLAEFLTRLNKRNKSVIRRKNVYNNINGVKKPQIQHNLLSIKKQNTGLKKSFNLNLFKNKLFTVKPKNEFNSLRRILQRPLIRSAKEVNKKSPTTELYNALIIKNISNISLTTPTTPYSKGNMSFIEEHNSVKYISQRAQIRSAQEANKKLPTTESYNLKNKKLIMIPKVYPIKSTTSHPNGNIGFEPLQQILQHLMNVNKNDSQVSIPTILKDIFPRTYDIPRLTKTADVIKNSKKRELADFIFFNDHFDFNANDGNNENNNEDTFNADIGSVGQVGVYEQLEENDESDLDVLPVNFNVTPFNPKRNKNPFLTNRNLKDTVWVHPEKQTIVENKVPSRRKYDRDNDKPVKTAIVTNGPGTENDKINGYINLSTAKKLYSDLDPLHQNAASEDGIPHFENDHAVKHRKISNPNLHPQLDDYNDEFLRDSNVETNRIGVDYVNYNYDGGDDLTGQGQGKYDKYSAFGLKNFASSNQKLPRQNVKQAKHILPKVHSWQKILPDLHSNDLSQDELFKYSSTVEKPKRVNFDKMNLDKDISKNSDNLSPTDVINQYYDRKEKRKKMMQLREKNNTINNGKKSKKQQLQQKVYMNVPTTAEVFPDIFLDKVKVYVNTPASIIKNTKKNTLHNSRELVGMWSKNHYPHNENSVLGGVSPLGIWTHKNRFHTVRPTVLEAERIPPEEEFDRRKREIAKRRSQLICILVKRPDQQELVKHVKATWGRRCDVIVLITSKDNKKNDLWDFTKAGLGFIYDLNHKDADWILKADINSYVVVENLKHMVKDYDPNAPLYFGKLGLKDFSNFVISKGALKVLVTGSKGAQACQGPFDDGIGYCLEYLGVKAVDSRDKLGRERFYPYSPFNFNPAQAGKPKQALTKSWSDYAVAFKNVDYQDMYSLDYLIYSLQPYNAPRSAYKKINQIRLAAHEKDAIAKPPYSKPYLTENLVSPYKYLIKSNDTVSNVIELDELKNQVKQLKELSVLKLFGTKKK